MATISVSSRAASSPFQTGVLTLRAAGDEAKPLSELELFGKFLEGGLHAVADDENDVVDALRAVEALPGMGHDRFAGQLRGTDLVPGRADSVPFPAATMMAEVMT